MFLIIVAEIRSSGSLFSTTNHPEPGSLNNQYYETSGELQQSCFLNKQTPVIYPEIRNICFSYHRLHPLKLKLKLYELLHLAQQIEENMAVKLKFVHCIIFFPNY